MDSRTKQDFTRRITQSNRSELVVVLYDIFLVGFSSSVKLSYNFFPAYAAAGMRPKRISGSAIYSPLS